MGLLNPFFLFGTIAAAVPVLLHLMRRADARQVEYPSLMFLRRISRRYIRFQKLRHLFLLLMRVLVLVLIALAFTRPYRKVLGAAGSLGQQATARIILLDNSMSMAYGSRWARAKAEVEGIVRESRPGDTLALLEFSDLTLIRVPLTSRATDVLSRLGAIETTDRATGYGQALRVAERVALEAGASRRVIYLVSDFQRSGVTAREQSFQMEAGVELRGVDLGEDEFSNLSLADGRVDEIDIGGEKRIRASCAIVHAGGTERRGTRLTVSADGRVLGEKSVDLPPRTVQTVELTIPAPAAGPHVLHFQVEDPNLAPDNRFSLKFEMRGKRPVVLVEEPARGGRSPGVFLEAALNLSTVSPFRLSRVRPRQLDAGRLAPGTLVIWNDAPAPETDLRPALEKLVRGGGGLVLVVADAQSDPRFSKLFGTWLPFSIGTAGPGNTAGRRPAEDYRLLTEVRTDHPIFRPFREPNSGSFSGVRFFKHARVKATEGADVLARFDNGDPALISMEVGKGRVLLFASSADDSGNDLPLKAVYAPLWHQFLRFLERFAEERTWYQVGDAVEPRQVLAGAALNAGREGQGFDGPVVVMDPARRRVQPADDSGTTILDQAGVYDIRSSSFSTRLAVNTPPRESDLTHAKADEVMAGWASRHLAGARVEPDESPITPEEQDQQQCLWRFLLLAALVLFLGEGFLSNRLIQKREP